MIVYFAYANELTSFAESCDLVLHIRGSQYHSGSHIDNSSQVDLSRYLSSTFP